MRLVMRRDTERSRRGSSNALQWVGTGALVGWMAASSFAYEHRSYGLDLNPYVVMAFGLFGGAGVAWMFWLRERDRS